MLYVHTTENAALLHYQNLKAKGYQPTIRHDEHKGQWFIVTHKGKKTQRLRYVDGKPVITSE